MSKTVLAYSSRESRRSWLRPISAWCCFCKAARSPRIHFATAARSAAVGCSSSSGGIRPDSISWRARNQVLPSNATSRSAVHSPSSFTPDSGLSPPWQPTHLASTIAATFAGTPAAEAVPAQATSQANVTIDTLFVLPRIEDLHSHRSPRRKLREFGMRARIPVLLCSLGRSPPLLN